MTVGIVLLLAVVEAGVLAPLMQVVVLMALVESWIVSAAVAVISAYAMHVAGRRYAGSGPHRSGDGRGLTIAFVAAWLVFGLALGYLRVVGLSMPTDITSVGEGQAGQSPVSDLIAALIFLLLYIIAGLIAFTQGTDRNDAHTALMLALSEWEDLRAQMEFWEGQLTRVTRECDRRRADLNRVPELAATERLLSAKLRAASLARVRSEIGRAKGDPEVLGIASPRHPDHPAHPDGTAAGS